MADKKDDNEQSKTRTINDSELWDLMTRDVDPIEHTASLVDDEPQVSKPIKKKAVDEGAPKPELLFFEQAKMPPSSEQGSDSLDKRTAERLRKGQMPIEGRLDLHGFRQHEAREKLTRFIQNAYGADKRCVLVITGKGPGEDGRRDPVSSGTGVLKMNTPLWLKEAPLGALVLKVQTARPQHGGEGAVYVLLRRKRS